jgi:hypothetical protein
MQHETLILNAPYELWRENGSLHLMLNRSSDLGLLEMKEILRLISALDPDSIRPILVHSQPQAGLSDDARILLQRSCKGNIQRFVAFIGENISTATVGEIQKLKQRCSFPLMEFYSQSDAETWFRNVSVHS